MAMLPVVTWRSEHQPRPDARHHRGLGDGDRGGLRCLVRQRSIPIPKRAQLTWGYPHVLAKYLDG